MIDMLGNQVEFKKLEPKKPSFPTSGHSYGNESRGRTYNDSYDGGFGNSYNNFGSGWGFGRASYRSFGGTSGRFGDYGYGGVTFLLYTEILVAIEEIRHWVILLAMALTAVAMILEVLADMVVVD